MFVDQDDVRLQISLETVLLLAYRKIISDRITHIEFVVSDRKSQKICFAAFKVFKKEF